MRSVCPRPVAVAILILALLALVTALLPDPNLVLAQTATQPALHDTFIDPNNQTRNYNRATSELTYSNFPSFKATRRMFIKFNLSGVPANAGATDFALNLVQNGLRPGSSVTVAVYKLDDAWDELTARWDNQPTETDQLFTADINAGFTGPVYFGGQDIAAYIEQERVGDGVVSFMLILTGGSGPLGFGGNLVFEDREGSYDGMNGNEPRLPATPMPTHTPTATPTATLTPTQTPRQVTPIPPQNRAYLPLLTKQ